MKPEVSLTFEAFCAPAAPGSEFVALTRRALAHKGAIALSIGAQGVRVALEPAAGSEGGAELRLGGHWRTADLSRARLQETGGRLMLPLLYRISQVRLPQDLIFSIGRDHRSPAGFFARNLLLGLLRNAPLHLSDVDENADARRHLREFQSQYFFALRSLVGDGVFGERNAVEFADMVMANCFVPVIRFPNPLLEHGCAAIRRDVLRVNPSRRDRLMQARTAILEQFQP